jgi:hypothetical protein
MSEGRHGHGTYGTDSPALSEDDLDTTLSDLGVVATDETRQLLAILASDSSALHRTIRRLASLRSRREAELPDIDEAVTERMKASFLNCTEPVLLRKPRRIGTENKLLLTVLLERLGKPVPLQELLLINGLRSATSRRLRELETEHGHFKIHVEGSGDATAYVLEDPEPDIDATANYWLKWNLRNASTKSITPHRRLLGLLSAHLGEAVSIDDLAYVLPKSESSGKGKPRSPQLAVARRVRELREDGYRVQSGKDKTRVGLKASDYILETLERLPPYERIKASVREEVLSAAGFRCGQCGWGPADGSQRGKKQLEVHHRDPQRARPEDVNDPSNLLALCNICHAGVEAALKKAIPPQRSP